jgi:hypothetical protein
MTESPAKLRVTTVNLPRALLARMDKIIKSSEPGMLSRSAIIRDALVKELRTAGSVHVPLKYNNIHNHKYRNKRHCPICHRAFNSKASFGSHYGMHVRRGEAPPMKAKTT